jgi:hypothetical protein
MPPGFRLTSPGTSAILRGVGCALGGSTLFGGSGAGRKTPDPPFYFIVEDYWTSTFCRVMDTFERAETSPSDDESLMYQHNLIYFTEVDRCGRFAVWEQPELFSAELRAAFRSLRQLESGQDGCSPSCTTAETCARWPICQRSQ